MANHAPLERVIRTNADLFALWQTLMGPGGFGRRSLWLTFLDEDNRTMPVIVPIDDVPTEPDGLLVTNLGLIVEDVLADEAAGSVAMLLSRPGAAAMTGQDRRWAVALRAVLPRSHSPWPIHLATTNRIQVFAPDDLLAVS